MNVEGTGLHTGIPLCPRKAVVCMHLCQGRVGRLTAPRASNVFFSVPAYCTWHLITPRPAAVGGPWGVLEELDNVLSLGFPAACCGHCSLPICHVRTLVQACG